MFTIIISQSKSKVNTNIKIAINDSRIASIYDWISRCTYFCSPALFRFGAKIRPLQLQRLAVSAPDKQSTAKAVVYHLQLVAVYHQDEVLHIIIAKAFIQPLADDMHAPRDANEFELSPNR